jgi:hypothetical protein
MEIMDKYLYKKLCNLLDIHNTTSTPEYGMRQLHCSTGIDDAKFLGGRGRGEWLRRQ